MAPGAAEMRRGLQARFDPPTIPFGKPQTLNPKPQFRRGAVAQRAAKKGGRGFQTRFDPPTIPLGVRRRMAQSARENPGLFLLHHGEVRLVKPTRVGRAIFRTRSMRRPQAGSSLGILFRAG